MDEPQRPDDARDQQGRDELLLALREHDVRDRAFDVFPDALVVVDANGTVADLNRRAEELLGRSRDERLELSDALVRDDDADGLEGIVTIRRGDGTTASALARSVSLASGSGAGSTLVILHERTSEDLQRLESERDRRRVAEAELDATREADRLRDRMNRLQAITDAALVHLSLDDLFETLLERLRELLHADAATVLLLDPTDGVLRVRAATGLERPPEQRQDVPVGSGVAGRIAQRRRAVIINDLRRARPVSPFLHEKLRSLVGVPILHAGEVTGVLHVASATPRRFTEDDIALLEIVAARLAPAVENAQLHEAERAARAAAEHDASRLRLIQDIAEVLGTIRSAEEIAEAVLEHIVPTLGASGAAIAVVNEVERSLETVATVGYDDAIRERFRRMSLDDDLPIVSSVVERRPVLIHAVEELRERWAPIADVARASGSWAALPLIVDGAAVGALALSYPDARPFDDVDVELLDAIAHQCAQAIDRARRYAAERRIARHAEGTARRLALLQSLTARFSRALTPAEVASVTVSEAAASLGADSGAIMLLDDEGMFALHASHGYRDEALAGWQRFPADLPTPAGDALRTMDVVVIASSDEMRRRYPIVAESLSGRTTGPTTTIPIVVDQRAIGTASFTFDVGRVIDEEDRLLMLALGRHAGQALERARLYETEQTARREAERARERTERLQALAGDLGDADTTEEVAAVLAQHMLAALGASATSVLRLREGNTAEIVASRGYLQELIDRFRVVDVDADLPLTEVIRTRVGRWIGSRDELERRYPGIRRTWDQRGTDGAFAAIPLKIGERVLGAVGVEFSEPREWPESDKDFLRAIARQAAQAMDQVELRGAGAQTRAELERSERRYRSLVESTSAIHWTVDPAGAFVEPQPSWEAYTGQPWDEHRGFGWIDAVHGEDRESVMDRWFTARDAGAMYETEMRLWHASSETFHHVAASAAPVRDDDGRIVEWVGIITDVDAERRAELARGAREAEARAEMEIASERLAYLAAASNVLAASLDVGDTLQRLAQLAVPRLADWCTIDMLREDGSIELAAVAHVDPRKVELAHDLRRRYPPDPNAESGMPSVLRTGRSFLMERIPPELLERAKQQNPELAELVDELELRSIITVPIAVGDRVLGAMTFVWAESGHEYDAGDLSLAEDLAHRAGVAIENARLYEAERSARREEARARERFQVIAETGAAMARSLDQRRVVEALARTASRRIADIAVVYVVDHAGRIEDHVVAHRDRALEGIARRAASARVPTPEDPHSAVAEVLRTGERALVELSLDRLQQSGAPAEQLAAFRRLTPSSELAVPLTARGRMLGVLALVRSEARPAFDEDDAQLATDLARRAALMLDNARLYAEREEVAETLQRSLLPPDLPEVPGLDIGARYLPAAEGLTVGGDFYDVFELDLDHWGVVIGDVVGKGAPAAAMMGLARYTVRTAAMAETRPSALLRTLNDAIVRQTRESMFCTACFAHLHREPSGVRVTLSAGGHPLPYVIRADGSVQTLGEPGTLLGIFDDPALTDRTTDLAPGDALVLYTDGVTDERRGDEDFGEARLVETLARSAGLDAAGIVDAVVAAVESFRSGSAHDDIAVLVIRARRDGENEA
jgi:PAS domain S-box-containing protein